MICTFLIFYFVSVNNISTRHIVQIIWQTIFSRSVHLRKHFFDFSRVVIVNNCGIPGKNWKIYVIEASVIFDFIFYVVQLKKKIIETHLLQYQYFLDAGKLCDKRSIEIYQINTFNRTSPGIVFRSQRTTVAVGYKSNSPKESYLADIPPITGAQLWHVLSMLALLLFVLFRNSNPSTRSHCRGYGCIFYLD